MQTSKIIDKHLADDELCSFKMLYFSTLMTDAEDLMFTVRIQKFWFQLSGPGHIEHIDQYDLEHSTENKFLLIVPAYF